MKPEQETKSNLISRWLGLSSARSSGAAPLQLTALEDRVLYSAGPVPVEVVTAGADLLSLGELQDVSSMHGLLALEADVTNTLEYLQLQIDAAASNDSIVNFQALDGQSLDGLIALGGDNDALEDAGGSQVAALAASQSTSVEPVMVEERVTAAVSAGFAPGYSISGRVLHDLDGDGSVDENLGLEGVEVTLFTDIGNGSLDLFDAFFNGFLTEATDANGYYEFTDLEPDKTYFVVVNSLTLGEHFEINGLLNSGSTAEDVWGVQTYASAGALFDRGAGQEVHAGGAFYGGYAVDQSDSLVVRDFQHIIRQTSLGADAADVDFGFSFNVVTNTLGGDSQSDSTNPNQSVQGSLRQFIANANAIAGDNSMRFVPVVDASETLSTGDIWRIDVDNELPWVVDAGTTISGLGYHVDGSPIAADPVQVSSNGAGIGLGVNDGDLGPDYRPLLELSGVSNPNLGLVATADSFEVSNLALVNFRNGILIIGEDVNDAAITDNFIGVRPDGSPAATPLLNGVAVVGADNGRVEGNYIVDSTGVGIGIDGNLDRSDQAEDWLILNNYIVNRDDIGASEFSDGISLSGGTDGAIVFNNRIENSAEFGIDLWNNRGSVTIHGNSITGAGSVRASDGVEVGGGIGLTSPGNLVQNNEISDNLGAGILVRGTSQFDATNVISATGNLISQNYFEANSGLDIDITRPQDLPRPFGTFEISAGDGLNPLDGTLDADTGSNGIDRPEISLVGILNDVLTIEGSFMDLISDPKIELYLLGPNDSKMYFDTITVADFTSYDATTGDFSAELAEPTGGWPSDLVVGAEIAAIIVDGATSDTSEFSLAAQVNLTNQPAYFETVGSAFSLDENTTFVANLDSTDPEGGRTRYSVVGGDDAALFEVGEDSGDLEFLTAPDYENPSDLDGNNIYHVIINVQDEQGYGVDREFSITVDDAPEDAAFTKLSFDQQENSIDQFQLNAVAIDGSSFTYQLQAGGDAGVISLDISSGEFSLFVTSDFENPSDFNQDGVYSFTVVAVSSTGYLVTEEIEIVITDVVETAVIDVTEFTAIENQQDTFVLFANAADGASLSYTVVGGADQSAFTYQTTGNNFQFSLSSVPDYENPTDFDGDNVYEFILYAATPTGYSVTETISVSVGGVDEVGSFAELDFSQLENTIDQFQLTASAPDTNEFTFQLLSGGDSDLIDFDSDTGVFSLLDSPDFENPSDANGDGVYSFFASATSDTGHSVTGLVEIAVLDVVESVSLTVTEFFTFENELLSFSLLDAVAEDGSGLVYSAIGGDDLSAFLFSLDSTQFSLREVPNFEVATDFNGDNVYEFTVRVQSVTGIDTTEVIRLHVGDFFETVDAVGDIANVLEGAAVQVDVVANDAIDALDRLESLDVVGVSNGTASFNGSGQLEFVHDGGETTSAEVEYRIVNQQGNSDTATVVFAVDPVDDLAVVVDDNWEVDSTLPTSLSVARLLANDFDRDSNLSDFDLQVVDGPSNGTVAINNGLVEYTPFGNFEGTDTFTYQLVSADGRVRSDVAEVNVLLEAREVGIVAEENNDEDDSNEGDSQNDLEESTPEGKVLTRPINKDDEETEFGRVQPIPGPIELEASRQATDTTSDSRFESAAASLLLGYESNVYSYFGRTQFLDLASQELSAIADGETIQSKTDFHQQLTLSQFVVGPEEQNSSSPLDISNLKLEDFNSPILGAGAFMTFAVITAATLTSSQIPRVLDVGQLLDDEESIEEIVSS